MAEPRRPSTVQQHTPALRTPTSGSPGRRFEAKCEQHLKRLDAWEALEAEMARAFQATMEERTAAQQQVAPTRLRGKGSLAQA